MIYYLCGRIDVSSVSGMPQITHRIRCGAQGEAWTTNADEAFYALARLENGACGTLEANKLAIGTNDDFRVEIYGDRGALRFDLMDLNFLSFYDGERAAGDMGGDRGFTRIECVGRYPEPAYAMAGVKAPIGWLRGHIGSYHAFLEAVAAGRPAIPSFADAAHIQEVLSRGYGID